MGKKVKKLTRNRRAAHTVIFGFVFFSAVISCNIFSPGPSLSEQDLPDAVVEQEELPAIEAPTVDTALLIFLSGDVSVRHDPESSWSPATIGASLPPGASIQVGDGFAELQFGDVGTVRIQEQTTIAINALFLQDDRRNVALSLERGGVLNKVDQLAGRGDYRVRTSTAVCGVRGTQFGVNIGDGDETQVAVREGSVSVLPSSADPDRIREKAGTSAAAAAVADSVIQAIDDSAPVVEANQELVVDRQAVEQTEVAIRAVEERIAQVAAESPDEELSPSVQAESTETDGQIADESQAPDGDRAAAQEEDTGATGRPTAQPSGPRRQPALVDLETVVSAEIAADIRAVTEQTSQNVRANVAPAVELSREAQNELNEIETIRYIELPRTQPAAAAAPATADQEEPADRERVDEEPEQEPEQEEEVTPAAAPQPAMPVLVPLVVNVQPRTATIKLDDRIVGTGSFSGVFLQGDTVNLKMEMANHAPKEMMVTLEKASGRSIRIELAEIPQPVYSRIEIQVEPSDATIVVNGQDVGTRRFRERYEVGTHLEIRAELDGYVAYSTELNVQEDQEPLDIELERKRANLRVSAEPSDAQIAFADEVVGAGSAVRTFAVGDEIPIRVARAGYFPVEETIQVAEAMQPISFRLERIYHPVEIQVEPAEAAIFLNDDRVGSGSAALSLPEGDEFTIRAEAQGYDTITRDLTVQENLEPVSMILPRTMGRISVEATPEDAMIRVDGSLLGIGVGSGEFPTLTDVLVTVERPGYEPAERTVSVDKDPTELRFDLERMYRTVSASVVPRDAQVYLNGRRVGTGEFEDTFAVGEQLELRFALDGYHEQARTVEVSENQQPLRVSLDRIMETLRIQAEPSDAYILIDGRRVGRGSATAEAPVGTQVTLQVNKPGYHAVEQPIQVEQGLQPIAVSLAQIMGTVRVAVEPRDTVVIIDGRRAGTGRIEYEYPAGTSLELTLEREDYFPQNHRISVAEGMNGFEYTLQPAVATLAISAQPSGATIEVDGRTVGTGSYEGRFDVGTRVSVTAMLENHETVRRTVTVAAGGSNLQLNLERQAGSVRIQPSPADAEVLVDGRRIGSGETTHRAAAGDRLRVSARREGFAPADRTVTVRAGSQDLTLRLEPRPIERVVSLGRSPLVRSVVTDRDRVFVADSDGTVYCVDSGGDTIWQVSTQNVGNENSMPVVSGNRVLFSGAAELVVLDRNTGRVINRRGLSSAESHLFGRRAVPYPGGYVYPTDSGLALLDADGSDTGRTLSVPSGSKATPTIVGGRAYIADQQGAVHVFDLDSGASVAQISTGMSQPVAHAPAYGTDRLVFVGRRGTVAAIDTRANRLAWEKTLPGRSGAFTDPVVAGGTVVVQARSELVAYRLSDGAEVFGPVSGVSTAATVGRTIRVGESRERTVLAVGMESGLVALIDPDNGRRIATVSVNGMPLAAAAALDRTLVFGLDTGELVFIHPDGME